MQYLRAFGVEKVVVSNCPLLALPGPANEPAEYIYSGKDIPPSA